MRNGNYKNAAALLEYLIAVLVTVLNKVGYPIYNWKQASKEVVFNEDSIKF